MPEEQLKAFLEAIKADAELQERLTAAGNPDAVVAIARESGFMISAEGLQNVPVEMPEEELEGIAGGHWCRITCG